jgi:hypothetical protein
MNVEDDSLTGSKLNAGSRHYSTFDAMYRSVFKFDPAGPSANNWVMAPFSKDSYTNAIHTQGELQAYKASTARSELSLLNGSYIDPSVQLVMPFGPATPNRTGVDVHATIGLLNNLLQAKLIFTSLKEIDPDTVTLPTTSYSQIGGGIKIDIGGFIGWKLPFYVSSSFVRSTGENDGVASDTANPKITLTSDFYCENLYFKFWKRAALLGGIEMINNESATQYSVKQAELMYEFGLEYKVTEGSYVIGSIGQMQVNYSNDLPADSPMLLLAKPFMNFAQPFVNLSLRVLF